MAVTAGDVGSAARVMGVALTEPEIALMLDNIEAQIELARVRRAVGLRNEEPMALRFDPRPESWTAPRQPAGAAFSDAHPGPVPQDEEAIAFAPLPHLSAWIRTRQLSSRRLTDI